MMSFAQFELTLAASQQEDSSLPVAAARAVFQRANKFAFLLKLSFHVTCLLKLSFMFLGRYAP